MSEMLERVTRAVEEVEGDCKPYEFEDVARAVLRALREPTEEMYEAVSHRWLDFSGVKSSVRGWWTVMIDAALEEPE